MPYQYKDHFQLPILLAGSAAIGVEDRTDEGRHTVIYFINLFTVQCSVIYISLTSAQLRALIRTTSCNVDEIYTYGHLAQRWIERELRETDIYDVNEIFRDCNTVAIILWTVLQPGEELKC